MRLLKEECGTFFEFQGGDENFFHTYYTFPILIKENAHFTRRELCEYLEFNNIETRPLFAGCLPDQPAFKNQPGRSFGNLEISRYIRDNLFFVGIHPYLKSHHLELIAKTIISFVKK